MVIIVYLKGDLYFFSLEFLYLHVLRIYIVIFIFENLGFVIFFLLAIIDFKNLVSRVLFWI